MNGGCDVLPDYCPTSDAQSTPLVEPVSVPVGLSSCTLMSLRQK
jgi:hypothetical protein